MSWFDLIFFSGCGLTIAYGSFVYVRRLADPTPEPKKSPAPSAREPEDNPDFWSDQAVHGTTKLPPLPPSPTHDRREIEQRVDDFISRLETDGITKVVFDFGSLIRPQLDAVYGPNFHLIKNYPRTRWSQASSLKQCLNNPKVFRHQPSQKDFIQPELLLELLYQLLFRAGSDSRPVFRIGFIAQTHRAVVNYYFSRLFDQKDHPIRDSMVYTPKMVTEGRQPARAHEIGLPDDTPFSVSLPLIAYFEQRVRHDGRTVYIGTDPTVLAEIRKHQILTLDLTRGYESEFA